MAEKNTLKGIIAVLTGLLCFAFPHLAALKVMTFRTLPAYTEKAEDTNRIHFLKTGCSDAIILESGGHFAMVDGGEDTDNPRNFPGLELAGYEQEVLGYLKEHCADESGKVHLDFIVGTHAHSDHIGGFDTIISDPGVSVDCAYLKEYDSSKINDYEIEAWDNQEVYDQLVSALRERNTPIIIPDSTPFTFGSFTVTLMNTVDPENSEKVGENDNSLGVLLEKNGTKIFLAGDIDNYTSDETRLAPQIGKIDLLKVGHHCNSGSSTEDFISALLPGACVITNNSPLNIDTLAGIIKICRHDRVYITGNENGVVAVIGDNGKIDYYGRICDWKTK
ncbi:MAG: MBL fold metallo-hydrolase [Clostridia bacterium]|nr:MBL fold metallo-hydrolase [Clostridia bacterium]